MKLLVLSDSHGRDSLLEQILRRESDFDTVIHLGDGADDLKRFASVTGVKPVLLTKGNCDPFGAGFQEKHVFRLEEITVLACHGHRFHVNFGLEALYLEALKEGAKLCLYGHTHIPKEETAQGICFLNPGAVKDGRYAVIGIENGLITPTLKTL